MKCISKGLVTKGSYNSSLNQTLLYAVADERFKIFIHSESYDEQSYATLSKWTKDAGWAVILKKVNLRKNYKTVITATPFNEHLINENCFSEIEKDLLAVAKRFVDI